MGKKITKNIRTEISSILENIFDRTFYEGFMQIENKDELEVRKYISNVLVDRHLDNVNIDEYFYIVELNGATIIKCTN